MGLLELRNITKQFGGLTAVGNVNISVADKEIYGLIGPNGAGKTTIFNLITGIYELTEGEIHFAGKRIDQLETFKIADSGITRTFQNIRLFKNLSTFDNILTACHYNTNYSLFDSIVRSKAHRNGEKILFEQAEELLGILGLESRRDIVAKNLPYGLQRRLEIARALALRPKLLLLDEPAAGMNPEETIQLLNLIKEVRDKFDLTILVIEHHMDLIMNLCNRITVLNFGSELATGTPQQIQSNPKVVEAYLGEEVEE
ncbi:MAG: high-affinity branched-chain amino acid ABC transporter ATP-binding protein LivG [Clostridiales bacterium]|nr:MAG: high-affinity branched-chain amino acid ABC transporter ATP-binding protein LivG [Clostridiales bacterium]